MKSKEESQIDISERVALALARDHRFKEAVDVLLDVVYATEVDLPPDHRFVTRQTVYIFRKHV